MVRHTADVRTVVAVSDGVIVQLVQSKLLLKGLSVVVSD